MRIPIGKPKKATKTDIKNMATKLRKDLRYTIKHIEKDDELTKEDLQNIRNRLNSLGYYHEDRIEEDE